MPQNKLENGSIDYIDYHMKGSVENMAVSRRGFLKLSFRAALALLMGGMFKGIKPLFAATETANVIETMYKVADKVPRAGRYQCVVCKLIVEYLPKHIEKGATFGICTLCNAGTEKGKKKRNEEFWKYIG